MDEATLMQMRIIAVETAIEKLNKTIGEFQQAHTGLERLGALENRIKVLEESRQRQIQLNSTFQIKSIPIITPQVISDKKSFWNLFK